MLRWMLLGILGLLPRAAGQAEMDLVPLPEQIERGTGVFRLDADTALVVTSTSQEARWAAELLDQVLAGGMPTRARQTDFPPRAGHVITFADGGDPALAPEGYELRITPEGVRLLAPEPLGLLRGVQTLRQLLPADFESGTRPVTEVTLPAVRIADRPRYRWRGMLLDCCRHFMDVDFVKRYIDLLAYHRMSVLHWHLTEDQGWRIQIDRYPKLTEVGAWRGPDRYGGFYSKQQVREVLEHARRRGITVVPEIELPGHSSAALAAYPNLGCSGGPYEVETRWGVFPDVYCAGNDETFAFLEGVLEEVIDLFPGTYIHIGGDECPKTRWQQCPKCQARIKAEGLADEHELQSYFVRRIEKFLNSRGRRLIGWDEILEGGLAPNATVQSWRGMNGAVKAASAGHDVISSPTSHCYLDYAQQRADGEPTFMGYIDLETCYAFEPTPSELSPEQARHVLGLEGNMWTEHAPQERVDYQVFPRLSALAEVGWSPKEKRDWPDFSARLATHLRRLDALGVTYFQPAPTCGTSARVFPDSIEVVLSGRPPDGTIVYTLDGTDPDAASACYTTPLRLTESTVVTTRGLRPGGGLTSKATYRFIRETHRPALPASGTPGLARRVYAGALRKLPADPPGPPTATDTAATCDLAGISLQRDYLVHLAGRLRVPRDGAYTFHLTSDDGSRLTLSGREVIDNDGLHGARTVSGQIMLAAGDHELLVEYFQAGGAQRLKLEWSGPDLPHQVVPASAFWHEDQ